MHQFFGFIVMTFLGFTLLNRMAEGALIAASEVAVINALTITRDQTVFGLFTVPVLNTDFFFDGIPALVKWDYSFFGGNAGILAWLMYSITAAFTFMLFILLVGMVAQFFARR